MQSLAADFENEDAKQNLNDAFVDLLGLEQKMRKYHSLDNEDEKELINQLKNKIIQREKDNP